MTQLNASKIGLLTALVMAVLQLLAYYVLHLPIESDFNYLVYAVFSGGVVWAVFQYTHTQPEPPALKQYFFQGFRAFISIALLMAVYAFFFFRANTAFRDSRIAENTQLILQQGNHTPDEIKSNEAQLRQLFMPIMISSTIFRYIIIGALISLIASGIRLQRDTQRKASENH